MDRAIKYFVISLMYIGFVCCSKDFLDEKPNSGIVIPKSLDDLQGLLDNTLITIYQPTLGQLSSDDYYMDITSWGNSRTSIERNCYKWERDVFKEVSKVDDWNQPFQAIFYCNVVLDELSKFDSSSRSSNRFKQIEGSARFLRAFNYAGLVDIYAKPYTTTSSKSDLGLPIRKTANVDEILSRSNLQNTYDFIVDDLVKASKLINQRTPTSSLNRPSLAAVYALLARVMLKMGRFGEGASYADSSLLCYNKLINYNSLSKSATMPFASNREEILLDALMVTYRNVQTYNRAPYCVIDSVLYSMYDSSDLRKYVYFQRGSTNQINVKFLYQGIYSQPFAGLAVDEVYLIKSESLIQSDRIQDGITTLNQLLVNRWEVNKFVPYSVATKQVALAIVRDERRKELLYRGIRWSDLRRYNSEGSEITLKRILGSEEYTLSPNDPRYVFPIPPDEIAASGIEQNVR